MAKMPWEKYATPSKAGATFVTVKTVRAAKPGKSPQEKMLDAIDWQISNLGKDIGKKAWFRRHPNGNVVKGQVRYGTKPLVIAGGSTYVEFPASYLEQFLNEVRAAVAAGKFDDQLDAISANMADARRTKG